MTSVGVAGAWPAALRNAPKILQNLVHDIVHSDKGSIHDNNWGQVMGIKIMIVQLI